MSSNSSSSSDYAASLTKLSTNINNYLSIILPSIGIPCNLISVFIFWRLRRNKSNMVFLGIFQSLVDAVLLLFVLLLFRSQYTIGFSISAQTDGLCKLLTFIRRYIYIASSWMHVLITFDRVIFVLFLYRNRFRFMINRIKLTAMIFTLLLILALLNIPNFFFYLEGSTCTSSDTIDLTTDIVSIIFRTYIPFILMIVFNLLLINKIFNKPKSKVNSKLSALNRREFQLTFSVMMFDAYFFFVNFPLSVYFIFSDVNTYSGALDNNKLFKAQYSLFSAITNNFAFFQQTFSFFLYFSFNKLFRSECIGFVGMLFGVKRQTPRFVTPFFIGSTIYPTRTVNTTKTANTIKTTY